MLCAGKSVFVNAEVVLDLPGGAQVAAVITKESLRALAPVMTATALFKASSVVLGAPA